MTESSWCYSCGNGTSIDRTPDEAAKDSHQHDHKVRSDIWKF
jgi:hypothetical protein